MNRLTRFLFDTNISLWRYSLLLVPIAILPAVVLVVLSNACVKIAGLDATRFAPPAFSTTFGNILGIVVFAPFIETYLLALLIAILSSFMSNNLYIAIIAGLIWGLAHASFGLLWFFGPAWIFFVLACAYITWRGKSFRQGYLAAFVPHVLNNSIVVLAVFLSKRA